MDKDYREQISRGIPRGEGTWHKVEWYDNEGRRCTTWATNEEISKIVKDRERRKNRQKDIDVPLADLISQIIRETKESDVEICKKKRQELYDLTGPSDITRVLTECIFSIQASISDEEI